MRNQSRQQFRSMFYAKVSNPRNGALIGYVGDVSESGLKIVSDAPFVQDEHLQMHMQMREEKAARFDLDARCKWATCNTETGYFEAGFILQQPSPSFTLMVKRLRKTSEMENTQ
ncbi:MAG TPA: PilZ domain-containing protein [Cellvibrio sp.]